MGRMLGSYADDNELDRPDLNKCPDCKCYFAGDNCPLCGKPCPEEMRAGNRKPVKVKKSKQRSQPGRVTFVSWYHSWWFILLMMWFVPWVGIILLLTSPHKKWIKISVVVLGVLYTLFVTFGLGGYILSLLDRPVDTSLSQEEYIATCTKVTPQAYYRAPEQYVDEYVTMTLVVTDKFAYGGANYYVCQDPENAKYEIYLCEFIIAGDENFAVGEVITVYGEGTGIFTFYDENDGTYTVPCINLAYATLVEE